MLFNSENPEPGVYELTNETYHASNAVSKSTLDPIMKSAATVLHNKNAPRIKSQALDFGTAFHSLLLEPETFSDFYVIEPKINKRTTEGKEQAARFKSENKGKHILTLEEIDKLEAMRDSVAAHIDASWLLSQVGVAEASIFFKDKKTGLMCKIRPDLMIKAKHIIVDVKTCADIEGDYRSFQKSIEECGYHKQDAFYSDGYEEHFGVKPMFLFLVVSTSLNCGLYPVRVYQLDEEDREQGRQLNRLALDKFADRTAKNNWHEIETIRRTEFARNKAEQLIEGNL